MAKKQEQEEQGSKEFSVGPPVPNPEWREVKKVLDQAKKELLEDLVYQMATEGMTLPAVARYFGVPPSRMEPYAAIHDMGKAALERKIFKRQLHLGMTSNFAQPAFFCGVQFAGQNTGKISDDDGVGGGDVNVKISVVGAKDGVEATGVGEGTSGNAPEANPSKTNLH